MPPEDAELLRRFVEDRSEAAFAELVTRHLGLVYAAALRQLGGATHRAEEVAQSVFIDLAHKAAVLAERSEIVGWLYTSTHYAAAKLKRSEQRRQSREQEAHAMNEILSDNGAAAWDRLRPVLDDAMLELGEHDREAILMRFFQGRRFAEVGRKLGLSEDAARMRVERALEKLRTLLARREITSTTAALGLVLTSQPAVALPATLATSITGAALASASSAGAVIAAGTFLMKAKTTLTAAIVAFSLGLAVYEFNGRRRVETEQASARAELASLRSQARASAQRTSSAEQKNFALQQELEAARAKQVEAASVSFGNPSPLSAAPASTREGRIFLRERPAGMSDEELRQKGRQDNLDSLDERYRALYRQLDFTPEQEAQFKRLMAESSDRHEEQSQLAMKQNPTLDQAGRQSLMTALTQQGEADLLTAIRGTFGDATFQAFQRYCDTLPARVVTRELTGLLFYSETPLTVSQAEQLVAVVAANSRDAQNRVDLSAVNNEANVAQAQSFLSPPQLAALRRAQAQVQQRERDAAFNR